MIMNMCLCLLLVTICMVCHWLGIFYNYILLREYCVIMDIFCHSLCPYNITSGICFVLTLGILLVH